MTTIVYELPETYESITRPVAYEIIKQLRDNLGIINKDILIKVPGANGRIETWNSNNIENRTASNIGAAETLVINIREEYIEDDLLTMQSRRRMSPPFWVDQDLGIYVRPVYSRTKVILNIRYETLDRWQAESFRDYWRRKIADNRDQMVFNARYFLPVPVDIEKAIYLIYHTRKKTKDDFPTWQHYLFGYGSKQLTSLTNTAGKGDTLALAERAEYILGSMTDVLPPELEKVDTGSQWSLSFDFEYHYDKPISVTMEYPIAIYNELVPPQLYPEIPLHVSDLKLYCDEQRSRYTHIANTMAYNWWLEGAFIRIPEFDDWSQQVKLPGYKIILSALVLVDDNDDKDVFNLTDMGDYGLHEALRESFKNSHQYLTQLYEHPFHIAFYEKDDLVDEAITVDENLTIRSKKPMNKLILKHVTISIVEDISTLTPAAQIRLFKDPKLVNAWLDIRLGTKPINGYPTLLPDGRVDPKSFVKVLNENYALISGNTYGGYTAYDDLIYYGVGTDNKGIKGRQRLDYEGRHHTYNGRRLAPFGLGSIYSTVGIFSINTKKEEY